jgi:integrase
VHSLRHFHASILILKKTSITEVAARLGHASPAVTMSVYAHFLRHVKGESTNAVVEALAAARR